MLQRPERERGLFAKGREKGKLGDHLCLGLSPIELCFCLESHISKSLGTGCSAQELREP